jgi:hypothetical protein
VPKATRARVRRQLAVAIVLIAGVALLVAVLGKQRHSSTCPELPAIAAQTRASLVRSLERVPCLASGRVVYDAKDSAGEQLASLDPIAGPGGGYLGVYDTEVGEPPRSSFRISLGRSSDLLHWTRVRVLDPVGAEMPTLRQIPGSAGYLLAYEKIGRRGLHFIRIRYYASYAALVGGAPAAQADLPVHFSRFSNGTPALVSIDWRGGPRRSLIGVLFHYESALEHGKPGPDREALGTLVGFRHWHAARDSAIDSLLERQGFLGSHGDRRQFTFAGRPWRVYEAETRFNQFSTWHVLLYDVSAGRLYPLVLTTANGRSSTSFGTPTAQLLPAPGGRGSALVVTIYVFGANGRPPDAGELVYYQPLATVSARR